MTLGGLALDEYMAKLLRDSYSDEHKEFCSKSEKESIIKLKETKCYLSMDYQADISFKTEEFKDRQEFDMPDGKRITLREEMISCPELLFQPYLDGKELDGLPNFVHKVVADCDVDLRAEFYANIVLSGGTTSFQNLPERLLAGVKALVPEGLTVKVDSSSPDRRDLTWIGGWILNLES